MKILTQSFSVVQWFGEDYPYYIEDAEENTFKDGDTVIVLMEVTPNGAGRMFVVYNPRINESTVVHENYLREVSE